MELFVLPLAAALAPFASRWLCKRLGLVRPNFRGDRIPAAVGLTFLLFAAAGYAALSEWIFLLVSGGFGLLGFWDDWRGDRSVGGFRGHLGALRKGRVTTGFVKLAGGLVIAGVAGYRLDWDAPVLAVLDAALVALAANAVNLLDLRPGRACFASALLLLPSLAVGLATVDRSLVPTALLLIPLALEWPSDSRGRAMLGDTGANLLGATAGLAAALCLPPVARLVLALLLLALNVVAERVSISKVIAQTPWLDALDRRLGVRAVAHKRRP